MRDLRQTVYLAKEMGKGLGGGKILLREMQTEQNPLILTLKLDAISQAFFDDLRRQYFPPERNFLNAHLTLFHQLPNDEHTRAYLRSFVFEPLEMTVIGLRHLGYGVAYLMESAPLLKLHQDLKKHFLPHLIRQDLQAFRPHITIQNKVTEEASKQLLALLNSSFIPFKVNALGMDLWTYLGGPWRHEESYPL